MAPPTTSRGGGSPKMNHCSKPTAWRSICHNGRHPDDRRRNDESRHAGLCQYLSLIHISEPTRLLSISYAVFCLKKKKKKKKKQKKVNQKEREKKVNQLKVKKKKKR